MTRARVAIVGLGYWGPNLARNFDDLAELRWLCDASPDALERFGTRYPQARASTDYDEVLADPELNAVVVATPAVTHYELAKRALEAGKHVLVEKPPAMNAAEAEDLVATAEATRLTLMPRNATTAAKMKFSAWKASSPGKRAPSQIKAEAITRLSITSRPMYTRQNREMG